MGKKKNKKKSATARLASLAAARVASQEGERDASGDEGSVGPASAWGEAEADSGRPAPPAVAELEVRLPPPTDSSPGTLASTSAPVVELHPSDAAYLDVLEGEQLLFLPLSASGVYDTPLAAVGKAVIVQPGRPPHLSPSGKRSRKPPPRAGEARIQPPTLLRRLFPRRISRQRHRVVNTRQSGRRHCTRTRQRRRSAWKPCAKRYMQSARFVRNSVARVAQEARRPQRRSSNAQVPHRPDWSGCTVVASKRAVPGASGRGRSTKSVLSGPFAVHVRMAPRGQQGRRGAKLRKIAGPRPRPKARARTQATRVSNGCISLVVPELAVAIRTRGKRVLAAQVPAAHCAHGNRSTSGRRVRSWDGCIIRHSVQRGLNDSRR